MENPSGEILRVFIVIYVRGHGPWQIETKHGKFLILLQNVTVF